MTWYYTEKILDTIRKLPEFINEFSKVVKYKILYINNKISEWELKETILFTITSKRIKYLAINLRKGAKDLHSIRYWWK